MTCQEFWSRMPEFAALDPRADGSSADPFLLQHTRQCASCAALMERQGGLRAGLRRLALEQGGLGAPARLETALLREFRAHAGGTQAPARAGLAWLGTLTGKTVAAALVSAALATILVWYHPPSSHILPPSSADVEEATDLDSGFVPLPYAGAAAPNAEAAVVRVEVPRSTLVALGAPLADQATGGTVEAELMLGLGGMPQAVRVVE
jgi:hypothetical protein